MPMVTADPSSSNTRGRRRPKRRRFAALDKGTGRGAGSARVGFSRRRVVYCLDPPCRVALTRVSLFATTRTAALQRS